MWPLDGLREKTFRQSVAEGRAALAHEISRYPGKKVVVGYSLGAVVANESRKDLEILHGPAGNPDIHFVLISNAYKPNGGILTRFPGMWIPFMDIYSTDPASPSVFTTTDVTNEYDTIGDFPAYFNPLAIANALVAFPYTHPDQFYDNTDLSKYDNANAIADKTQTADNKTTYHYEDGTTKTVIANANGSTSTYYVVHTKQLPLLRPLRALTNLIGASFVLDAIEPTLRLFIDMAYDREASPGAVRTFSFFTPPKNIIDALKKLPGAIAEGAAIFQDGLFGAVPKEPRPADKPTHQPAPHVDVTRNTPPGGQIPGPTAAKEPVLSTTTSEPSTHPVPAKVPGPTAIEASVTTPAAPEIASSARAAAAAVSDPALDHAPSKSEATSEGRLEAKPGTKPDHKTTLTSVKDTDATKHAPKPTPRLPELSASQSQPTPKALKPRSIKDSLKSIPGLGFSKVPTSTTGGGTDANSKKGTGDTGNSSSSGSPNHANTNDHSGSSHHSSSVSGRSRGHAA